jgi:formylglycine-generating enzyme required for sulfatase activity
LELREQVLRRVAQLEAPRRSERLEAQRELLALGEKIRPILESLPMPADFEPREALRYVEQHLVPAPRTVTIPAGRYRVGSDDLEDRNPPREVELGSFTLDVTEVTCFEYFRYVTETGAPPPADWRGGRYAYGEELYPVRSVSFAEARRFAAWAGGRLPTADEWEVAGHLGTGTAYPWGEEAPRRHRNAMGALLPVLSESRDVSPAGCYDLAGSLSEWVELPSGVPAYRGGHYLARARYLRITLAPLTLTNGEPRKTVGLRLADRGGG